MKKENKIIYMQLLYFTLFCTVYVFINPQMQELGYSVKSVGGVLAIGAILSILLQNIFAKLVSNVDWISNQKVIQLFLMIIFVSNILSYATTNRYVVLTSFCLIATSMLTAQTFVYTFIFEYINCGYKVNFGLGRGLGSMFFAVSSLMVGYIARIYGFSFLFSVNMVIISLTFLIVSSFDKGDLTKIDTKKVKVNTNIIKFIKRYPKYIMYLIGVCMLFITHVGISTYLIDISFYIKKDSFFMGLCLFIAAVLELPAMAYYEKIKEKIGNVSILYIAFISFSIKVALIYIGLLLELGSIIFFAHVLQIFGFAIYLPASLFYVNRIMSQEDRVMGQAYLGIAGSIANVLANNIGSILIFNYGVLSMVLALMLISTIGTVVAIKGIEH